MKMIIIRIAKGISGILFGLILGILIIIFFPFVAAYFCFKEDLWPPFGDFYFWE